MRYLKIKKDNANFKLIPESQVLGITYNNGEFIVQLTQECASRLHIDNYAAYKLKVDFVDFDGSRESAED